MSSLPPTPAAEEFAIYLNYVRKLGFEETPDYDFLRDLFTKALKNTGEVEDGVYDWMLLNDGQGWQANSVSVNGSRQTRLPTHPQNPLLMFLPLNLICYTLNLRLEILNLTFASCHYRLTPASIGLGENESANVIVRTDCVSLQPHRV